MSVSGRTDAPQAAVLRYRFDSPAQLRRHAHPCRGGLLLFFPDPWLELEAGTKVALEVAFDASDQRCTFSGAVQSVEQRSPAGTWLQLTAPGLLPAPNLAESAPRRRHPRVTTCIAAVLHRAEGDAHPVHLVDVSLGGARLVDAPAMAAGELITVHPIDPSAALGCLVCWAQSGESGVEFRRSEPPTRTAASALLSLAAHGRDRVRDVRHPISCTCLETGRLLEPSRPRIPH